MCNIEYDLENSIIKCLNNVKNKVVIDKNPVEQVVISEISFINKRDTDQEEIKILMISDFKNQIITLEFGSN